jgi:hypothetical protein
METLNAAAADRAYAIFADAAEDEAKQSWLAAQRIFDENVPNGRLAIWKARGGSRRLVRALVRSRGGTGRVVEPCDGLDSEAQARAVG